MKQSIQIIQLHPRHSVIPEGIHVISAQPDAIYTVVDAATEKPPEGMSVKRNGDTLEVLVGDEVVAQLYGFFAEGINATFNLNASLTPAPSMSINSTDDYPVASDITSTTTWEAEGATGNSILADTGDDIGGIGFFGGLTLLGVGIWAIADNGSNEATPYDVVVTATAGSFISAMEVEIYDQYGNQLNEGSEEHDFGDGTYTYTITDGYIGPLLARLIDSNGAAVVDYLDEATSAETSLDTTLRAMTNADGANLYINNWVSPSLQ